MVRDGYATDVHQAPRLMWWQVRALLVFNEKELTGLKDNSKLKQGTLLRLPQIHVTKLEDETCTSIATRFGQSSIWPERTSFSGLELLELQNKASGVRSACLHYPFVHHPVLAIANPNP